MNARVFTRGWSRILDDRHTQIGRGARHGYWMNAGARSARLGVALPPNGAASLSRRSAMECADQANLPARNVVLMLAMAAGMWALIYVAVAGLWPRHSTKPEVAFDAG